MGSTLKDVRLRALYVCLHFHKKMNVNIFFYEKTARYKYTVQN